MDVERTGDEAGGWEVVKDNKLPGITNESTVGYITKVAHAISIHHTLGFSKNEFEGL
jgi:hypothetical protein